MKDCIRKLLISKKFKQKSKSPHQNDKGKAMNKDMQTKN